MERSLPGSFVDQSVTEGRERLCGLEFDEVRMGLLLFFQLRNDHFLEEDKVACGKG